MKTQDIESMMLTLHARCDKPMKSYYCAHYLCLGLILVVWRIYNVFKIILSLFTITLYVSYTSLYVFVFLMLQTMTLVKWSILSTIGRQNTKWCILQINEDTSSKIYDIYNTCEIGLVVSKSPYICGRYPTCISSPQPLLAEEYLSISSASITLKCPRGPLYICTLHLLSAYLSLLPHYYLVYRIILCIYNIWIGATKTWTFNFWMKDMNFKVHNIYKVAISRKIENP